MRASRQAVRKVTKRLVATLPPPPPPGHEPDWDRLTAAEQARLREFHAFWKHIEWEGCPTTDAYFSMLEMHELNVLEDKLRAHRLRPPNQLILIHRPKAPVRHERRASRRNYWWAQRNREEPKIERRDLSVWPEEQPGPGEVVSAVSEAGYDWMPKATQASDVSNGARRAIAPKPAAQAEDHESRLRRMGFADRGRGPTTGGQIEATALSPDAATEAAGTESRTGTSVTHEKTDDAEAGFKRQTTAGAPDTDSLVPPAKAGEAETAGATTGGVSGRGAAHGYVHPSPLAEDEAFDAMMSPNQSPVGLGSDRVWRTIFQED